MNTQKIFLSRAYTFILQPAKKIFTLKDGTFFHFIRLYLIEIKASGLISTRLVQPACNLKGVKSNSGRPFLKTKIKASRRR
jgi:hypothetical protein